MRPALPPLRPWVRLRDAVRQLLSGATATNCVPVAVVVGTLRSLIDQADVIAQGVAGGAVVAKVLANYATPFLTSSTGALLAARQRPTVGDSRRQPG